MSTTVRVLRQAVGQAAKALHLEPFKRVTVRIDPFHSNATPVRDFLFHVSTSRVRLTNPECALKTEVLCDRSEPTIEIAFCLQSQDGSSPHEGCTGLVENHLEGNMECQKQH
ncbi:hypothetical protein HPB49_010342 [Dermacentor silvarum]|uniref:Uncharacterized protein n=1 Tax=Dermacentor silvarum TaxID=543639 RepID=A0ACB8CWR8_DERSI|nr:hypothetical protein HPB49_010342 [Dermacentor silvarum]